MKKCLICVDIQNDFINPESSLQVENGDQIIPIVNKLLSRFELIIFTQDWHPVNHKSFASQYPDKNVFDVIELNGLTQVLWPDHCVQYTKGAELHQDINFKDIKGEFYIFKKGTDPEVDSYSGFYDNGRKNSTGLTEVLNERGVESVYIVGLAFDYCCKYTAIDSVLEGFDTTLIIDATRAISKDLSDTKKELEEANVKIIESWELSLFEATK